MTEVVEQWLNCSTLGAGAHYIRADIFDDLFSFLKNPFVLDQKFRSKFRGLGLGLVGSGLGLGLAGPGLGLGLGLVGPGLVNITVRVYTRVYTRVCTIESALFSS